MDEAFMFWMSGFGKALAAILLVVAIAAYILIIYLEDKYGDN